LQEIEVKNTELKTLRDEVSKLKLESSGLKEHLEISKTKLLDETSKLEKSKLEAVSRLEEDLHKTKSSISEKNNEIESLKMQILDLNKTFKDKEDKLNLRLESKESLLSKANLVQNYFTFKDMELIEL